MDYMPPAVEMINQRRALEKIGAGRWKGCCPFCEEENAVYETLRVTTLTYICTRCFEQGDLISFIMHCDHVGFIEAVSLAAAHLVLPLRDSGNE